MIKEYMCKYVSVLYRGDACWHNKQLGIAFHLCIYGKENNEKVTAK